MDICSYQKAKVVAEETTEITTQKWKILRKKNEILSKRACVRSFSCIRLSLSVICIMWHQTVYCRERELSRLHHFIPFVVGVKEKKWQPQIWAHKYNLYEWGWRIDYVKSQQSQRMFSMEKEAIRFNECDSQTHKNRNESPSLIRLFDCASKVASIDQNQYLIGIDVWSRSLRLFQLKMNTQKTSMKH